MKYQLRRLAVAVGLSAVLGSTLLIAQTSPEGSADIPFAFRLQDRALPAGSYSVREVTTSGVLDIRNQDTGEHIMFLAPPTKSGAPGPAKLIFNCYDDKYFLSQVWFAASDAGRIVGRGHLEKEIASVRPAGVLASIKIK